ncbi:hypothetical protein TNCV_398141 [Trichonephila clavipes]|nr:hypothetical protein TNCV_398141 [Trichonephila clavipes]
MERFRRKENVTTRQKQITKFRYHRKRKLVKATWRPAEETARCQPARTEKIAILDTLRENSGIIPKQASAMSAVQSPPPPYMYITDPKILTPPDRLHRSKRCSPIFLSTVLDHEVVGKDAFLSNDTFPDSMHPSAPEQREAQGRADKNTGKLVLQDLIE